MPLSKLRKTKSKSGQWSLSKLLPVTKKINLVTEQINAAFEKQKLIKLEKELKASEFSIIRSLNHTYKPGSRVGSLSIDYLTIQKSQRGSMLSSPANMNKIKSIEMFPINITETEFFTEDTNYYPLETFFFEKDIDFDEYFKTGAKIAKALIYDIGGKKYVWIACKVLEYYHNLNMFKIEIANSNGKVLRKYIRRLSIVFEFETIEIAIKKRNNCTALRNMHEALLRYSTALKIENDACSNKIVAPVDRIRWIMKRVFADGKYSTAQVHTMFEDLLMTYKETASKSIFDNDMFHNQNPS